MTSHFSFSAIHTFTIVAKELSFTRAAEILHITPSAVSHQMKLLENQLGISLFIRKSKGVKLSVAGETLQKYASTGVSNIHQGIQESLFSSKKEKLIIAIIPSLCNLWFIPRIKDFYHQFPNIELELVAQDQLVDFTQGQFDGHIHFGTGDYRGLEAEYLSSEKVYPVCHPELVRNEHEKPLTDLLTQYNLLLYKAGIEDQPGGISWTDWFNHFQITRPAELNQMWFSHVSMTITAAKHQQGIALGWDKMVADDLTSGHLIKLSEHSLNTHYNYYLVAPNKTWQNPAFKHFSVWLKQQMSMERT